MSGPRLVNNQFNSPIKLYSPQAIQETLDRQSQVLSNGAIGIDFNQLAKPANLQNSAVLKMLEEEEERKRRGEKPGLKKVTWPPEREEYTANDLDFIEQGPVQSKTRSEFATLRQPSPLLHQANSTTATSANETTTSSSSFSAALQLNARTAGIKDVPFNGVRVLPKLQPFEQPKLTSWKPVAPPTPTSPRPQQIVHNIPVHIEQGSPLKAPASPTWSLKQQQQHQPQRSPDQPVKLSEILDQDPYNTSHYQPVRQSPVPHFEPPPTTITLRSEPPISQETSPVYLAQPAATSATNPGSMRGDQKWPPQCVKEQVEAENRARVELAKGPVCRPRRPNKDYTNFFAQHALTNTYPSYRTPPGTQFYSPQYQQQ